MYCQQLIGDIKHVKNYLNFLHVVKRFSSVVEIPIKHSSLYNKKTLENCVCVMACFLGSRWFNSTECTPLIFDYI